MVALLAVLVIGAVVGWWFFTDGPGARLLSPPGSVVADYSGNGNQLTTDFAVRAGWRIEWQNEGTQFAFAIRGDRDFGRVVDQQEPGNGTTFPTGGGRFHLDVTANGAWSVTVFQGD